MIVEIGAGVVCGNEGAGVVGTVDAATRMATTTCEGEQHSATAAMVHLKGLPSVYECESV